MSKDAIKKIFNKDGERVGWQFRWRDPAGTQKKRNFKRKSEAEQFALHVAASLRDHTYIDPNKGKETFKTFAEAWRATLTASHNYQVNAEMTLRLHVYPLIGDKPMHSIDDGDIKALIKSMIAKGLKPGTIRTRMTLVRGIFKAASQKRVIPGNPCIGVRLPKGEAAKVWLLEPVQVKALIANFDARYRALIILGAATGARQGELFGLQVGDVTWSELKNPSVHLQRQLQFESGRGLAVRPLKNYDDRVIPIPVEVVAELARHVREFPPSPEGYLFTRPQGGLINARVFRRWPWERACRAAAEEFSVAANVLMGAEAIQNTVRAQQMTKVTMHQLRDYYASMMFKEGWTVAEVATLLGHANQATTLKHYSHVIPGRETGTRAIVSENLRKILPSVP